jgi:uncharacterized protein DUF6801
MKRLLGGGIAGVLLAAVSVLSAPVAAATPVDKTIAYDCTIPIFGHKTLNLDFRLNIPASGTVGSPIQLAPITIIVPLPHDIYDVFTPFGATQADGTLEFSFVINGTTLPVTFIGPPTQIPDPSGRDLLLVFVGTVPPFTPDQAGTVSVAAGTNFEMHVTPRDAGGNPTVLGTLDVPGTAAGADTQLGTVVVS